MELVFLQVDVHVQGIFAKYPICYIGGITQRTGAMCSSKGSLGKSVRSSIIANPILIFQKTVLGIVTCRNGWMNTDEIVGNIEEEVLDGAGLIKEVAIGHQDVDKVDDEEDNDDEDNHENPHFFQKG
uniref:Uncharacterized protein n=1 Tax=Lactuca sativa TaxID=4236 RepID=A0A9R1XBA9_LACSA|nr:hypothetical protein LSAT_V11C500295470 [Lactuca sativa]